MNTENYLNLINADLEKFSATLGKRPAELYDPISYILSFGGKRLRPLLTLLGCDLFNGDVNKAIKPALGIEVFHNFTLVHDDIMDQAPLRRNRDTVHKKWNSSIAILSGDAMFVKAYQLMVQCPPEKLMTVLEIFNTTALQVCEGQQLDMNYETKQHVSIPQYISMIELKTAVLLAASLQIGAVIGGAKEEDAKALYEFGKNIGIAFQLQDDILDVYAQADKFGKQVGGDIISNKKTFLLLKALELSNRYSKEELHNWMFATEFVAEEKVKAITDLYNFLGVRELAKKEMLHYYDKALKNLETIPVSEEKKKVLLDLADSMLVREV